MSFILDALKKSESERQRQSVPSLLDIPMPARKPRIPVWGILLGLLMGVNLVVLVVVLARHDKAPPAVASLASEPPDDRPQRQAPPAASQPAIARPAAAEPAASEPVPALAPAPVAASAGTPFSPMDGAPVYAPEIPVDSGSAGTREPGMHESGMRVIRPEPAAPARPALPPKEIIPPNPDEVVPTLQELNLSGNHAIPDLHLDLHVYAARPADRFVFINNRKYKEGSTLQEGPTVERITRDGVLLRYQNLRFLLPRQ